ncbi:MAG: hypothetical protein KQI81_20430 [Deltaproteobacteria bacterium]|nr:hypothetical protein [Deltaproteobacteria bacterium]
MLSVFLFRKGCLDPGPETAEAGALAQFFQERFRANICIFNLNARKKEGVLKKYI